MFVSHLKKETKSKLIRPTELYDVNMTMFLLSSNSFKHYVDLNYIPVT